MTGLRRVSTWVLTTWGGRIVVAFLTVAAFLPVLRARLLGLDDTRFIVENQAIHELSPSRVASFFTDPTTVSGVADTWAGIYRPLRTLDFAIDWAIAGDRAWFYHLRSLLYHVLASLLALAVFHRLTDNRGAALFGAMLFALHPVQVEAVAWVSSRGDVLLLVLCLTALLLHLEGRFLPACLVLVAALLAKETAVVFPGIALLADLLRRPGAWRTALDAIRGRAPPRSPGEAVARTGLRGVPIHLRWCAVYGFVVVGYYLIWLTIQPYAGHIAHWWGGSWATNGQMMLRAVTWYVRALLLPVSFAYDYHVPAVSTLDAGTVLGVALLAAAVVGILRGSSRTRVGIAWALVAIFPVSNLLFTVAIPTAERFLYLPSVGLAFAAGHLLSRFRRELGCAALLCLGALTFTRCLDWHDDDTLFTTSMEVEVSPRGYLWLARKAGDRAREAYGELKDGRDDPEAARRMRRDAGTVVAFAEDFMRYYRERLGVPAAGVGSLIRWNKANALLMLGRDEEAYEIAKVAASEVGAEPYADYNAALAAQRLAERREGGVPSARAHQDAASVLSGALTGCSAPGLAEAMASAAARLTERRSALRAAEYFHEAAEYLATAHQKGYPKGDLRTPTAILYMKAGDLRIASASSEPDVERQGDLREAAGENYFNAGNALGERYLETSEPELLDNAIRLHRAGADAFHGAAEALAAYRTPAHLAHLLRMSGTCFYQLAREQEMQGDPETALRTFLVATAVYERALRAAAGGEPAEATEATRRGAAYSLFQAGRIAESRGDASGAAKLYEDSLHFLPTPEAGAALRGLSR